MVFYIPRLDELVCSYNGGTTGTDALWAGVPILTLPLNKFAARSDSYAAYMRFIV